MSIKFFYDLGGWWGSGIAGRGRVMTGERVTSEPAAAWCGEMGAPGAKTTNTTTQLILTQ